MQRAHHTINAAGKALGRLAGEVARLLYGKHKPEFVRHKDIGDFVTVINVSQLKFTGKKLKQKKYYHHTGYPRGLRATPLRTMWMQKPDRLVQHAVRLMLPDTKLRKAMLKRLTVKP